MNELRRTLLIAFAAFVALAATACPDRTSIADIEANPTRYQDKEVAIAGRVVDSYGLSIPGTGISGGAYKIDDGSGAIWVITENAVPSKGAEIGIKGRVGSGVNYKGKNYGLGIYEQDRRYRKR